MHQGKRRFISNWEDGNLLIFKKVLEVKIDNLIGIDNIKNIVVSSRDERVLVDEEHDVVGVQMISSRNGVCLKSGCSKTFRH